MNFGSNSKVCSGLSFQFQSENKLWPTNSGVWCRRMGAAGVKAVFRAHSVRQCGRPLMCVTHVSLIWTTLWDTYTLIFYWQGSWRIMLSWYFNLTEQTSLECLLCGHRWRGWDIREEYGIRPAFHSRTVSWGGRPRGTDEKLLHESWASAGGS